MKPRDKPYKVGDLVEALYRGNAGIVFEVTEVYGNICKLVPCLDPNRQPVTKKHGYQVRTLHHHWLRGWKRPANGTRAESP